MAYWMFDAAVLWAMLSAFGSPPSLPVLGLAYLLGQVANTLPIPGSVSGGMTGVLIAWGVPVGLALPAVLAYRTIAVWLPAPAAISAIPGLRATLARWAHEDAAGA
jgi:putative heme transporter